LLVTQVCDFDPYQRTPQPLLVVISGPSGVGKDTTLAHMRELGYPFHFVVTATTRPQRPGEVHGQDYYFVSADEFTAMIQQGELLEHALVYGEYKGIPKSHVRQALASGQDVILRLDVQGAATIRQLVPGAVLIFLEASSEEELAGRLQARKTESPQSLEKRLATVRQEMAQIANFDYVVVNRDNCLDDTVRQIAAIITAEKCRVRPRCIVL
jgi:guanylate kinase